MLDWFKDNLGYFIVIAVMLAMIGMTTFIINVAIEESRLEEIRQLRLSPREKALERWNCDRQGDRFYSPSPRQFYECEKLLKEQS